MRTVFEIILAIGAAVVGYKFKNSKAEAAAKKAWAEAKEKAQTEANAQTATE